MKRSQKIGYIATIVLAIISSLSIHSLMGVPILFLGFWFFSN